MHASYLSPVARALRNATILGWLRDCHPEFIAEIRSNYSHFMRIPPCELGDYSDFTQDADVLEWIAANYKATIKAWETDQL